jgi:hypothetical protein
MTTIYVAAPWQHRAAARIVMDLLQGMGHVIANDWTREEPTSDPTIRAAYRARCLLGLGEAEYLVLMAESGGQGCWFEAGYYYAQQRLVANLIIIPGSQPCIFDTIGKQPPGGSKHWTISSMLAFFRDLR